MNKARASLLLSKAKSKFGLYNFAIDCQGSIYMLIDVSNAHEVGTANYRTIEERLKYWLQYTIHVK